MGHGWQWWEVVGSGGRNYTKGIAVSVTSKVEQLAQKATERPYFSTPCDCFRPPTVPHFLAWVADHDDARGDVPVNTARE